MTEGTREYRILPTISGPADLRGLSMPQLRELAAELRDVIVRTTARNGGHLAPNLGAVEITLALHRVLRSPTDKIVWDVGHQSYVHKLITGRRERFGTIRQRDGLSGFPSRTESPHDPFGAGHGSTALSAALGLAKARDLAGRSETIAAVVGDGALTGGLALEALNHAGALQTDLLVLLNDNEMSIARNVGALSGYLSRMRVSVEPMIRRARADLAHLLARVPLGDQMLEAMDRIRDGVKQLVVPGMLFEELGITYLGPIDGHDLPALIDIISHAVELPGPVLVHALTCKGRGYEPAERSPELYHGTRPFDVKTGQPDPQSGPPTYTRVFGEALLKLAKKDARLVAITAAMSHGTGLEAFRRQFPQRFVDVGMCEQHATTFAAGLAAAGSRPVVAVYSTFLQRAYDQIVHDVCLQSLPVVFVLDRAGLVGDDGPTHHGAFDLSYLRHIPNLVVMAPKDEAELEEMLVTALELEQPSAIRYPRAQGQGVRRSEAPEPLTVGSAELLRTGDDVAIFALGSMVAPAQAAATALEETQGISAAVVNARFVRPLDEVRLTALAQDTGRVLTVEENALAGGFGSAVLELLADRGLGHVRVVRLGLPDRFIAHGRREDLLADCGLDAAGIAAAAVALVEGRPAEAQATARGPQRAGQDAGAPR